MDKSPKVYFFNDTSGNNHAGCKAVMRSLLHALKNVDIIASHNVHETTYNQAAMNECDVVFVNGEGTIHHHAPAGDFLMEMLALGQKLGKKTMLVNAVFQQLPPYYPEVLAALDFFSVREPFSADNAKESGGNPIVLLDSCADLKFLGGRTIQSLKGIVKGDVHPFSPSAGLFSELPYPFFGIDCAFEDFVATLRNVELYITGQHHGVYGAGLAGIPFVVVPSNSHKIESLISWSGLPIPICHSVTEIKTAIAWALENKHIFHAFQKFLFRNKVFTEELFQQGLNTNYPLFFNRNESSVRTEWQLPEMPLRPQPELIRIYDETSTQFKLIGSTGFFRNRPLLKTILNRIDSECNELKVLFHASSIGSDPFSFCIAFHLYFRGKKMPRLKVFAVDISAQFLNTAQKGCYPQSVLEGMIPEERSYFELLENDQIRVRQEILDMVTFLPPSSFVDFTSTINFDIVFLLNALCYVPAEKQALTIDRIASYNSDLLVVTAYNEDTIESDLRRNGYEPIKNNQELIYNSWQCRLSLPNECMIDGITFHTPALKPYKTISQNDFICTSLFSRRQKNFFCCNVKQNERLPFATGKNLVEVLGSRTVGILLHGKSIATLEQNISDFSELDICWCSINFFGIMEEKILNTIGKQMDVVFCSSRQEIINREHELAEYLQRDYNNILITTAEALKNVPALLNYSHKILTIPKPQLPAYLMPNSLTLLLEAIISMGCAEKIILFGADGLLNNTITVSSAYFGGELLAKQQREWLLVNDTTLFNARFPILLQRILHKQSRSTSPPIANCSPGTVITSFPVIDYIEAFKILTGTIDWPVIANLQQSQDSCKSPVKICEYLGYTLVRYGTQCFAVKPGINWQELTFDRLEHLEMYESKGVCFECITDEAGKNVIDMMHRANTVNLEEYRGFNIISHNGKIFAIANELGNVDMATITNQQLQNWQEQGLVFFADSASSARGKIDCSGYEASPLLLEENFSGYSVLKLGYKYMALSHALGSIDPLAIDISEFQTSDREHLVYINTSIEGVIDSIKGTNKMAINIIAGKNPTYGTTFKISRALLFDGLQPWRKTDKLPKEINPIPSMICDDECAYYHWLARYYFTGEGSIVDFGPLAGGYTY
jgi:chemotaxis methyl-accepting protein methylase